MLLVLNYTTHACSIYTCHVTLTWVTWHAPRPCHTHLLLSVAIHALYDGGEWGKGSDCHHVCLTLSRLSTGTHLLCNWCHLLSTKKKRKVFSSCLFQHRLPGYLLMANNLMYSDVRPRKWKSHVWSHIPYWMQVAKSGNENSLLLLVTLTCCECYAKTKLSSRERGHTCTQ